MRSNCGVYVDAGYLLASAAMRVTGTSLRSGIKPDFNSLMKQVMTQAEELSGLPVLRVHWYDAALNGIPDTEQEQIGLLPRVKLRLGRFGFDGQQKGVDLRIGLDLVAHARNGAVDAIVLVSGDDDLTEAVEEAQIHGVQVIVLAVPNGKGEPHGVSKHLLRAADDLVVISADTIDKSIRGLPAPTKAPAGKPGPKPPAKIPTPSAVAAMSRPLPTGSVAYSGATGSPARIAAEYERTDDEIASAIEQVASRVLESYWATATDDDVATLKAGEPSVPRDLDRALLLDLSGALDIYDLSDNIRTKLRRRFWELVAKRDTW